MSATAMTAERIGSTLPGAVPDAYIAMLSQDGHDNPAAFVHAANRLFRGVPLEGKQVLEIGSGKGLMAIYMGMRGAARVVSMEPELVGATSGVIALQRQRIESLGLRQVDVVTADFNTWDNSGATFDVILSRASLNHLYASDQHAQHDRVTYENYLRVARRIREMLAPGGVFIATDACRYAFFTGLRHFGIRRPWRLKKSGVDWRHHQNPSTWKRIFLDSGFSSVRVGYPLPYKLRHMNGIVDNAAANFFLNGTFVMQASR